MTLLAAVLPFILRASPRGATEVRIMPPDGAVFAVGQLGRVTRRRRGTSTPAPP